MKIFFESCRKHLIVQKKYFCQKIFFNGFSMGGMKFHFNGFEWENLQVRGMKFNFNGFSIAKNFIMKIFFESRRKHFIVQKKYFYQKIFFNGFSMGCIKF